MKNLWFRPLSLACCFLAFLMTLPAQAGKLRVVTSLTDLADFARNVGGDHIEVRSLASGVEDTHGIPMKPSFVPLLNRADLLIVVGYGCEHSFLPALVEASRNRKIAAGQAGCIDCSKGISPMEVASTLDRSEGDVHPNGNPHYLLDPVLARTAVQTIAAGLAAADPGNRDDYFRNRDAYLARLDAKIAEWQKTLAPARGRAFVSYHNHWPYFASRFGLVRAGTIEMKSGIDPTPRHIEGLVASMKAAQVPLVVREPQFPEKVPTMVAQQTGARLVTLPIMPGGVPKTGTYIEMMDYIVSTVAAALPPPDSTKEPR